MGFNSSIPRSTGSPVVPNDIDVAREGAGEGDACLGGVLIEVGRGGTGGFWGVDIRDPREKKEPIPAPHELRVVFTSGVAGTEAVERVDAKLSGRIPLEDV